MADLWELGGIGPARELKWRIFAPVFDLQGREITWTTRAIGNDAKRYISAPVEKEEVNIKATLYGQHLARHSIIITEGPVDAWAIGPGAVATCGVGYTQTQAQLAAAYPNRAVCFDAEPAAQRRAEELCQLLAGMPGRTVNIELETGDDPASADPAEIMEIRQEFL